MNRIQVIAVVLLVGLPGLALAEGAGSSRYVGDNLARQSGNFRYVGNNLAKQVCKAIAEDDVSKLRRALRAHQRGLVRNYSFDTSGRQVSRDFTCNGMEVQVFSEHVGASKVASFFSAGQMPDAQVAASGR